MKYSILFLQMPYIVWGVLLTLLGIFGFNTPLVSFTLVFSLLLLVWEFIEARLLGVKTYFSIYKNYLDVFGPIFYIVFAIAYFLEKKKAYWVFVPSLTCGLLRGSLTFFNLFNKTRYLI